MLREKWLSKSKKGVVLAMNKVLIESVCDDVPLPTQNHQGEDAGYDLHYSGKDIVIWPFQTKTLPVNCKIAMPNTMHGHVRSRSGLAKNGLIVAGGTVDSGFRGQVNVTITNASLIPKKFRRCDRIAQIVFLKHENVKLAKVDKLPNNSERGSKGFGSSGIKGFTGR